jgi:DNA-binding MarR family transcriptional regulator
MFSAAIAQISKCMQKLKTREMHQFGLRGTHAMCLYHLQKNELGLTASQLTDLCDVDKGAISRAVTEMQQLEIVTYPEGDGKRKYRAKIKLTDKGITVTEKLNRSIGEAVERAGIGLTWEERENFYKALNIISQNIQTLCLDECILQKGELS